MSSSSDKEPRVALLSILLSNRKLGWAMLLGGLAYFGLSLLGIHLLPCPVKQLTDFDCPGCGLTRGCSALIQGDWKSAIQYHWFSPFFALFWASVGFGLILPEPWRGRFLEMVRSSECLTRWPLILGVVLVIYTLTRNLGFI